MLYFPHPAYLCYYVPMANILLVRHGETEWVQKNRLAGWIPDIHLNEKGRLQADDVARRLAHLPVQAVYSSPILRCWETAGAIARAHQLELCELHGMIEVKYGRWEGEEIKTLAKEPSWHTVQHFPSRFRFPEGESMAEVQFRAVAALEEIAHRHPKQMVVVVSHADIIKLTLAYYLGVHVDLFQRIVVSPASVSSLGLTAEGQVRVLRLNDDGPIQAPPVESPAHRPDELPASDGESLAHEGGFVAATSKEEL
jgi:probable phosphomutase (TIGR03848 family)